VLKHILNLAERWNLRQGKNSFRLVKFLAGEVPGWNLSERRRCCRWKTRLHDEDTDVSDALCGIGPQVRAAFHKASARFCGYGAPSCDAGLTILEEVAALYNADFTESTMRICSSSSTM
jgi:hypothetical protein